MKPGNRSHLTLRRVCALALFALAFSCQAENGGKDAMPNRDINAVMNAHVGELMAIDGVVGVAVGALDDGTPCIRVLVVEETDEIRRKVPDRYEGHPVRVDVTGEIKPMEGK